MTDAITTENIKTLTLPYSSPVAFDEHVRKNPRAALEEVAAALAAAEGSDVSLSLNRAGSHMLAFLKANASDFVLAAQLERYGPKLNGHHSEQTLLGGAVIMDPTDQQQAGSIAQACRDLGRAIVNWNAAKEPVDTWIGVTHATRPTTYYKIEFNAPAS